jgi:uncharacterized protein YcbX
MEVVEIWRYPVKSLQGERLEAAEVGPVGVVGDRSHALRDPSTGVVLTARRDATLLFGRGILLADGGAVVEVPDHGRSGDDQVISDWVGRPVELIGATGEPSTYENILDPEDDLSAAVPWHGPEWSFHDSRRTQISIVATGDLRDWDVRRFRPNVVLDGPTADVLVGHRVRIGAVELDVVKRIDRCVMIIRPQPDGIGRDVDVFRRVRDERDLCMGVGSMVRSGGDLRVGQRLEVLGPLDDRHDGST